MTESKRRRLEYKEYCETKSCANTDGKYRHCEDCRYYKTNFWDGACQKFIEVRHKENGCSKGIAKESVNG